MLKLLAVFSIATVTLFPLLTSCSNNATVFSNNEIAESVSENETELVENSAARLTFALNVSQVVNGRPFHATCNIERWYGAGRKDYVVAFYRTNGDNSNKQLVGTHEVYAPTEHFPAGRHLFTRAALADVAVTSGRHFAYPTFDLVGSPASVTVDRVYWCELTDRSSTPEATYLSNVWAGNPVLQLSISKLSGSSNRYLARCTVRHFYPRAKSAYTLAFYVHEAGNVFGAFIRERGGPTELSLASAYDRASVGHGGYFDVPLFDLVYTVNTNYYANKNYYCRLFDDSHDDWSGWNYVTSNGYYSY